MSKILFNPDNGAPIHDVVDKGGTAYFTNEDFFMPGTLFKFEDERAADFFLTIFEFLQPISHDTAKKLLSETKLKCEKCDYQTRIKAQLERHKLTHAKDKELDDLGIPVIKAKTTGREKLQEEDFNVKGQQAIDNQENTNLNDGYGGLDQGEGLKVEAMKKKKEVIMS